MSMCHFFVILSLETCVQSKARVDATQLVLQKAVAYNTRVENATAKLDAELVGFPNTVHASVPLGGSERML